MVFALLLAISVSTAMDGPVDWGAVEPITLDNLHRLNKLVEFGHGSVYDLAWSPDGRYLAAATTRGIELFTIADLNREPVLLPFDSPNHVTFSLDGIRLAASGCVYGTQPGQFYEPCQGMVYVWELASLQAREIVRDERKLGKISFSPDGRELAVAGSWDSNLRIFDVATTGMTVSIDVQLLTDFSFSPLGHRIVTSSGSIAHEGFAFRGIELWDSQTGERLAANELDDVFDVGFSYEGSSILYHGVGQALLYRWIPDTDEIRPVIEDKDVLPDYLNAYYISPNGRYLLCPTAANWSRSEVEPVIWDVETGEQLFKTDDIESSVYPDRLALSPDASILAIGSMVDGVIELVNIRTGIHQTIYRTGKLNDAAFLDSQTIVFAGGGQSVWRWAFTQTSQPERIFLADTVGIDSLSPGSGDTLWLDAFNDGILLYDVETGQELLRLSDSTTRAIRLNPARNLLAYGSWINWDPNIPYENDEQCDPCGVLRLYDVERNQLREFEGHHGISETIRQVEFSSSGQYAISRSQGEVRIWDLVSGELISEVDDQCPSCIFYAGFTPDDQVVVGIIGDQGGSQELYAWTSDSWQTDDNLTPDGANRLLEFGREVGRVNDIVYLPEENLMFVATPYSIRIYSMETTEELWTLEGHTGIVTSMSLSSDRRFLISTGVDGTVRIWGVPSNK